MSIPASEFSLDDVTPTDLREDPDFSVPDHTASREERRSFFSYIGGKKNDDEAPPRARARKRKRAASRPKKGAFVEPLTQMYALAGVTLFTVDEHCGGVILENAEKCATAMDELAYQNESVRRALDTLVTGSAIGAVFMAHLPVIVAIASHHGGGKIPFVPVMVPNESPREEAKETA